MNYQAGDKITFLRADGKVCNDVVRKAFVQDVLLEPYARNQRRHALVLTEHSWCFVDDVIGRQPVKPDYDANVKATPAFRKVFYSDSLGRILRDWTAEVFANRTEACIYWWMLAREGVEAFLDCGLDGQRSNAGKVRADEPAFLVADIDRCQEAYNASEVA
jgi:hypothetical protein